MRRRLCQQLHGTVIVSVYVSQMDPESFGHAGTVAIEKEKEQVIARSARRMTCISLCRKRNVCTRRQDLIRRLLCESAKKSLPKQIKVNVSMI
jgi:hypothetical protein